MRRWRSKGAYNMFRSNRYANVAATLALVFSLAGTATATSITLITGKQVKDGSLSGADFKNNSISAKKLKSRSLTAKYVQLGSLTNREVQDGTLTLSDLSTDTIAALKATSVGAPGPVGPKGDAGATGLQGPAGPQGPAGSSIKLAGHAKTDAQTLPGDSTFHAAWSMNFSSTTNQLFILTGMIGNATAPCPVDQQVTVDGTPRPEVFNGGFLTFTPGTHTLSYEVSASCPIDVPAQEAILIPFTLP
jgi:hypothetical protein